MADRTQKILEQLAKGELTVAQAQAKLAEKPLAFKVTGEDALSVVGLRAGPHVTLTQAKWQRLLDADNLPQLQAFVASPPAYVKPEAKAEATVPETQAA